MCAVFCSEDSDPFEVDSGKTYNTKVVDLEKLCYFYIRKFGVIRGPENLLLYDCWKKIVKCKYGTD